MNSVDHFPLHPLAAQVHTAMTQQGTTVPSKPERKRVTAVDLLTRQPWAIQAGTLETIVAIARRENESPEAVAAKLGRPLQNTRSVSVRDSVAVVPVTGPIFRYANLFTDLSGATSLEVLAHDFNAALDDPNVSAIVLDINSPGGQADGIAEFAEMVNGADKRVTAYVGGMGASAAYWIAAAADELVLGKTAEVGSIGAVFGVYKSSGDDDVVEFVSTQSPMKRPNPESDEGRAEMQTRIDTMAQVFIEDVANYRGVSVETVLSDFGKGGVRLGEEAVRLGMADRVSTLESVIAGMSGAATLGGSQPMATETGQPAADKPAILRGATAADLKEHNPALFESIRTEGEQAGAGAEAQRIQDVFAQAMPGHDDLIQTLAFDGKTTGPEAAVQVLKAEREAMGNSLAAHKADAPDPVAGLTDPGESGAAVAADLPVEERAKADWDKSPGLREEFPDFKTYLAYAQAKERGVVRAHGRKKEA